MSFDPNQTFMARLQARLIPNWRSRLRDYSTIALALVTALSTAMLAAWGMMPAEWKSALPPAVPYWLGSAYLVIGAWGGIGKFFIQPPPKE